MASLFQKSFAAIRSTGRPGPRGILPMGFSLLFLPVGAPQARDVQIATTTTPRKTVQTTFCTITCIFFHKIDQTRCFLNVFARFCNGFLQSTVILHICRHKTVPKHHDALQCFQFPYYLPEPLKTPLFTVVLSIFRCCNAAGQLKNIYIYIQEILPEH